MKFDTNAMDQIHGAAVRASNFNLSGLISKLAKGEDRIASEKQKRQRRDVLASRIDDPALAQLGLERILAGNDLTDVNYLALGAVRSRSVCRIVQRLGGQLVGYGSGFLVAPRIVLTNHHVIPELAFARSSLAQFRYERGLDGKPLQEVEYKLLADPAPILDKALDFALIPVAPVSADGQPIEQFGYLPLNPQPGKAFVGEYLTIIQHPRGERKQVCVRENKLLKLEDGSPFLWYQTDTEGGSSGSPVFNNSWDVVALHHSGVPATNNKKQFLTRPGPDGKRRIWTNGMDPEDLDWIANEGVRISQILEFLRKNHAGHPLVRALLSVSHTPTPESASAGFAPDARCDEEKIKRSFNDGTLRVVIPIEVGVRVGMDERPAPPAAIAAAAPADWGPASATGAEAPDLGPIAIEKVEIEKNYKERNGYQPAFLGKKLLVPLPKLSAAMSKQALKVEGSGNELRYWNYTVKLNRLRRLAYFSAANVDPARWRGSRDADGDTWYPDDRVKPANAQVGREFYTRQKTFEAADRSKNPFDQGHLSRRRDLQWGGDDKEAKRNGDDSYHYPNCAPQHWQFNQNNAASGIWFRLEEYAASPKFSDGKKLTIINGPIFDAPLSTPGQGGLWKLNPSGKRAKDLVFGGVAIPKQFFKVMVCAAGSKLRVAAFVVTHEALLKNVGRLRKSDASEAVGLTEAEVRLYRVSIDVLERLTGLDFGPLGKKGVEVAEFAGAEGDGSQPITSPDQLMF